MTTQNRWLLAAAGVLMQIALGVLYAWSVLRIPLSHAHFVHIGNGTRVMRNLSRPVEIRALLLY
jgi:hypothetical protein